MLEVSFKVEFDKYGKIENLYKNCDVDRGLCKGCRFKKWCDKTEKRILQGTKIVTEDKQKVKKAKWNKWYGWRKCK